MYKTLEEIGDDLPDHSPRFILLSYPLTLVCFFSLPSKSITRCQDLPSRKAVLTGFLVL